MRSIIRVNLHDLFLIVCSSLTARTVSFGFHVLFALTHSQSRRHVSELAYSSSDDPSLKRNVAVLCQIKATMRVKIRTPSSMIQTLKHEDEHSLANCFVLSRNNTSVAEEYFQSRLFRQSALKFIWRRRYNHKMSLNDIMSVSATLKENVSLLEFCLKLINKSFAHSNHKMKMFVD